jgi:hypothetical protein
MTKLTPVYSSSKDEYFGSSVDISQDGNTVLIGAFGNDTHDYNAGAVYAYRWNGKWVAVGAPGCGSGCDDNVGSVYVYNIDRKPDATTE